MSTLAPSHYRMQRTQFLPAFTPVELRAIAAGMLAAAQALEQSAFEPIPAGEATELDKAVDL